MFISIFLSLYIFSFSYCNNFLEVEMLTKKFVYFHIFIFIGKLTDF